MGKFKKGDRVRLTIERYFFGLHRGDIGTLQEDDDGAPYVVWDRTGKVAAVASDDIEAIPTSPTTGFTIPTEAFEEPAFKLELGKYYRTRDGRKVGPIAIKTYDELPPHYAADGWHYTRTGKCCLFGEDDNDPEPELDLIDEWVDEPAMSQRAPLTFDGGSLYIAPATLASPPRRQLVKTKQGYGFEIARQGDYVWVDTGSTAPMTLKAADVVLADVQVAA